MPESTTMRPCYVFGPWTDRAPEDPIRAVREAPNPAERAEVWLYTKEDDGTPVSSDVAGWYGCFGAMTDSVRLGPPDMNVDRAKAALDILMFKAGHLFADDVQEIRDLARIACAEPVALPASPDVLARELYEASPLGPVQTWTWDKAPDVVRQVWRDTAMLVLRKYGQPPAKPIQNHDVVDAVDPKGRLGVDGSVRLTDRMIERLKLKAGDFVYFVERPSGVFEIFSSDRMAVALESGDDAPSATSPQEQGQWRDVAVHNPPTPTRRATDADSPIGDDRAPDRYMASGRETIDEVRDVCHALTGNDEKAANALFAAHCLLDAYVYLARAGRKGDAASDHAKSNWYLRMAAYVAGLKTPDGAPYTDPRAHRPTYTPYQRHPHALKRIDWGDFPIRDLLGAIAFGI